MSRLSSSDSNRFLVCGLGNLGRHCVHELAAFGARVSAIELRPRDDWELDEAEIFLEKLYTGDCRQNSLLNQIDLSSFRAALVVTSSDRVNIETAMAIRLLSEKIRIVMRSTKEGLNELLAEQLGNFVAFEPSRLSAPAFALAAMGDDLIACFPLNNRVVRVGRQTPATCPGLAGSTLSSLETRFSIPLALETPQTSFQNFYDWGGDHTVTRDEGIVTIDISGRADAIHGLLQAGDSIVDTGKPEPVNTDPSYAKPSRIRRMIASSKKAAARVVTWCITDHIRRVALFSSITILLLLGFGAVLFRLFTPQITTQDAFYDAVVLLLGGYSDLLGSELYFSLSIPWWLRLTGLMLTLSGTVFMGVIYAVLTQYMLSVRFRFKRKDKPPQNGHMILVGLGRVGKAIIHQLQSFDIPMTAIVDKDTHIREIPAIVEEGPSMEENLKTANLENASGLMILTRDELTNLEIGLLARNLRPDIRLVIRTYDPRFSNHLTRLWPQAHVMSAHDLAAKAFAAASFGEKIATLFRIGERTVLVTEYRVEALDTLSNRMLATIACGYQVVPLLIIKPDPAEPVWLPFDDTTLEVGDVLYVLATVDGILRVENGDLISPGYELHVDVPLNHHARFDGANVLSRMTGVSIGECRDFMEYLPAKFPQKLYRYQAERIISRLKRNMVSATLINPQSMTGNH